MSSKTKTEPHRELIEDKYAAFTEKYPKPTLQQVDQFLDHIRFLCSDEFYPHVKKAIYEKHGFQ